MRKFCCCLLKLLVIGLLWNCSQIAQAQAPPTKTLKIPEGWRSPPPEIGKLGRGFVWYRCWVDLPQAWQGSQVEFFLEAVDDAREAYINGKRIGGSGAFPPEYRSGLGEANKFRVAAADLKFGKKNAVAIRVYQNEGRSGFNVAAPVLFGGEQAIRLAGLWQYQIADDAMWAAAADLPEPPADLVFHEIKTTAEIAKTLKKLQGEEGPLGPTESLAKFKVADDLEVELVLSEPEIGQPLFMSFDARGRLWVVNFLQYPTPAGLKMVSRDKFLRSVYDKSPLPPPNHFRGADKITIHEDTNGDGKYDKHKTFVDGLSLVSSFAHDRDGVWVLNPPYLLFYPDKNHDDVPDGDPEVHLEGFGFEDSHSIANSLRWGPDGWLYAGQGSTVSADVKRYGSKDKPIHSLGQLIWRYHPATRRYEIFAEGGGNTFGVEFDAKGRMFSGHNGGDTRGFHYVQGGYFQKGFSKHGPLSNPYTFGYFPQMQHHAVARFTHNFVIYEGGTLPTAYDGKLFGVGPLQSHIVLSDVQSDRSSLKTKDIGHPLTTTDTWFRPVDIKVGPDGAVYIADMYEQRIDHASHYQGRVDKETGRIVRLKSKGIPAAKPFDYSRLAGKDLLELLQHTNKWHRQMALQMIRERPAAVTAAQLHELLEKNVGQLSLESLWALQLVGGLNETTAIKLLDHDDPYVRLWTVRLICDEGKVSPAFGKKLVELAYREPHLEVRSQLACSARRLPAADSLPIVRNLLARGEDVKDIHIPLLLWWAIEAKADADRDAIVAMFRDKAIWDLPLVQEHLLAKLLRRYAASGTRKDLLTCAQILDAAPVGDAAKKLMSGFEEAFEGRPLTDMPNELVAAIAKSGGLSLALRLRQGDKSAVDEAIQLISDTKANAKTRLQVVQILGQVQQPRCVAPLLKLVESSQDLSLRSAALTALQAYDDPQIGKTLVAAHNQLPADVRAVAQTVLASRKTWTAALLEAVVAGQIERDAVPLSTVRKILLFPDDKIAALVKKTWGDVQGATSTEMRAAIDRLEQTINTGSGNPYAGRQMYRESCGKCHTLFQDGGKIGPDLTSFKRDDLKRMLLNVVNPSAEIREGFENFLVVTSDGRALNGFIADQDKQVVSLRSVAGQTIVIPRDDIEELRAVPVSLMPEGLLKDVTDQQVRDLFAYLRSTQPLP